MVSSSNAECNKIIDQVIESRRTIRRFKAEAPPRELIEQVLRAGLLAPYAGVGVTREEFRRFVVIPRESKATAQIAAILKRKTGSLKRQLETQMQQDEFAKKHGGPFLEILKLSSEHGMPNIGKAPYYIVVAEERGIPAVEHLSLAHCLQNMWLKAAALGLGFQLLSVTEQLGDDKEFCDLIGIPVGEFALDGCLIGYPDINPAPTKRPNLSQITRWMD